MSFWKPGTVAPGSIVERPVGLKASTTEEDDIVVATFNAYNEAAALPLSQQRLRLPIYKHKNQLLYLIENHPVSLVIGQTGSGKTTQIPQYLHEAGWTVGGRLVVCTQPRRVAATSVASRVAEELECELGQQVGYSIRFDDKSSAETRIKYTTDGTLFRETLTDPLLSKYSVIMIDEAHERSIYTDLLLGLLKKIQKKRLELRIIIASATLDAETFASYFNDVEGYNGKDGVAIMTLEGRMFPVDILYLAEPCENYVDKSVEIANNIHEMEDPGDILIFLTGREEIDKAVSALRNRKRPQNSGLRIMVLPLYAGISQEQQLKIFEPAPRGVRKVVVATNIAEASITLEGVVYVIDCGFVKIRTYNAQSNLSSLVVVPTSQSSASQRAGRAGRVRPGKCYRLYPASLYPTLPVSRSPEIQRTNLTSIVLQLKALGIDNVIRWDWVSPPSSLAMERALELLYAWDAIDEYGRLTIPKGLRMAEIPIEPMLAKTLFAAVEFGCVQEMVTIAAMSSVESVFLSPREKRVEADAQKLKFAVLEGDHLTYLNVYMAYTSVGKSSAYWCHLHFLNSKSLKRATQIRSYLLSYLAHFGLSISSSMRDTVPIRKAIVSGYFPHAAILQIDGTYKLIRSDEEVWIHPSSALFKRTPKCLVFQEIVESNKKFMKDVLSVEEEWLSELAPHFYEFKRHNPK